MMAFGVLLVALYMVSQENQDAVRPTSTAASAS